MKMALTLWQCEVALSECCQAVLQGKLACGMGAGNGDKDVPQREPGLSVPVSPFLEALPGPLRGSGGEVFWALMVFMLAWLAGEQGELGCTWWGCRNSLPVLPSCAAGGIVQRMLGAESHRHMPGVGGVSMETFQQHDITSTVTFKLFKAF